MKTTTASKTIEVLRCLFSRFGIPHQLVSYNCPQFLSEEYKQFREQNGIEHIFVFPYHLSSSGEAESFILTFKAAIRKTEQKRASSSSHTVSVMIQNSPSSSDKKDTSRIHFWEADLDLIIPHSRKIVRKVEKDKERKETDKRIESRRPCMVAELLWN